MIASSSSSKCKQFRLNIVAQAVAILALSVPLSAVPAMATSEKAVSLNNEGVTALKSSDMAKAKTKFEEALKIEPGYKLAQENLAIAYNNSGLAEQVNRTTSLRDFHMSLFITPDNNTCSSNIDETVRRMGKDPKSFADRVAIGDDCAKNNDFAGAIIEYQAALKIKKDDEVNTKLKQIKIPDEWKRIKSAKDSKNSKSDDVDFGPYMAGVERTVKKAWFPPRANTSAKVVVRWKIHSDGRVSDVMVDKTSGAKSVDDAALLAVKNAKLAELPKGAPEEVDIQFAFDYNVFSAKPKSAQSEVGLLKVIADLEKSDKKGELCRAYYDLGQFYTDKKRNDEALAQYKKAIDIYKGTDEHNASLLARIQTALGDEYYNKDDYANALQVYRSALATNIKNESDSLTFAAAYRDVGYTLLYVNEQLSDSDYRECLEMLRKGEAYAKKSKDPDTLLDIVYGVGHCLWKHGDYARAKEQYEWVVKETERIDGGKSADLMQRVKDVADCDYQLGQLAQALPLYKRAVELAKNNPDVDESELAEANQRIDDCSVRLHIPVPDSKEVQQENAQQAKEYNKKYAWLPYALAGSLLSLLIVWLVNGRQDNTIDIAGRDKRKREPKQF